MFIEMTHNYHQRGSDGWNTTKWDSKLNSTRPNRAERSPILVTINI